MASVEPELFFDVQEKTDKQHILDNPDTYIGSVENVDTDVYLLNEDNTRIVTRTINYIPGLFKLFDEGIVNCRDHVVRMKGKVDAHVENALPVSYIDISVNTDDDSITMTNDGNGMDVAQKDGKWLPELVFGHLRTSTNFNKDEKKIVGGKNGYGFKLCLIWSTYGRVETVDHVRGLKYIQEYKHNLDEICPPIITKCKSKPYTKITFKPDYARLGITGLTPDIVALLKRRVYDIGAITDKSIKVRYNDVLVPVKQFEPYINMYIGDKTAAPRVYETFEDRWEYAVALSPADEFIQVSFVNGIHTSKGGKHVDYILNQIIKKMVEHIEKKKKIKVSPAAIKEQIILFVRCDIENPSFDSQSKDFMNTPSTKFGSKCEVSDKFIEKLVKLGIMNAALKLTEVKDLKTVKKSDGVKCKTISGIAKLTDANWAGTNKSHLCTLILCEGDSAKAGVLSGLTMEDRNTIGVYPMRGKLLNVRGELKKKIASNAEIEELVTILGLEYSRQYIDMADVNKHIRYSHIMFMTDQDLDGSHIKGLCVNLFACEWPSLMHIPEFIGYMNTPILKATKGKEEIVFYNDGEYEAWKHTVDASKWEVKYYKGLGTSTPAEFKQYFRNPKRVSFHSNGQASEDTLDMVFNDKRANDRKDWLATYNRQLYVDTSLDSISYDDFINKELIHFSKYDCDRSIPNLMDGLKISQRKILFAAFKRNLTAEIKVAQFQGYVSEHACYHHGEASLNGAIVGMAQNFVGSNNVALLDPCGQFGTRLLGGKDAASPRYIFTKLHQFITRAIFNANDDAVLTYLTDDGKSIEPIYYAPIVPMILVNGASGIGTGFSTDIYCYCLLQIIEYLQNMLLGIEDDIDFVPYYEGFKGSITRLTPDKFLVKGIYHNLGEDQIRITELPVGLWTQKFKELLEYWRNPGEDKNKVKIQPIIEDFKELWTDQTVTCDITFVKGKLQQLEEAKGDYGCNGLEKLLKLYTTISTTNMHLFGPDEILIKFDKVSDIIDAYYPERLLLYQKRKDCMIAKLQAELNVLLNKCRFIQENVEGTIDLRRKTDEEVDAILSSKHYDFVEGDYTYLTRMPMHSVTLVRIASLQKQHATKEAELQLIQATPIETMWLNELAALKEGYIAYKEERAELMKVEDTHTKENGIREKEKDAGTKRKRPASAKLVTKIRKVTAV